LIPLGIIEFWCRWSDSADSCSVIEPILARNLSKSRLMETPVEKCGRGSGV
jgi:hypothetical protein